MVRRPCRLSAGPAGGAGGAGRAFEEKNDLRRKAPRDESTGVRRVLTGDGKTFRTAVTASRRRCQPQCVDPDPLKSAGLAPHPIRISLAMNYPVRRRMTRSIQRKAVAAQAATAFFFCFFGGA